MMQTESVSGELELKSVRLRWKEKMRWEMTPCCFSRSIRVGIPSLSVEKANPYLVLTTSPS